MRGMEGFLRLRRQLLCLKQKIGSPYSSLGAKGLHVRLPAGFTAKKRKLGTRGGILEECWLKEGLFMKNVTSFDKAETRPLPPGRVLQPYIGPLFAPLS
jgi:hypothetical protein